MTERLSDISAHIKSVRQLGAVVNAMRGIAAARAQQARTQIVAVDSYAATIAAAIGRSLTLITTDHYEIQRSPMQRALVLFCAEQGFAGAFSERVLDEVSTEIPDCTIFLIGTRGGAIAAEREVKSFWQSAMPSHSSGVPRLADRIASALYAPIAAGDIDQLDAVFSKWEPGQGIHIERRRLFPFDLSVFPHTADNNKPMVYLPPDALLDSLMADYMHAQLCNAALHAFAAENEARIEAMASAHNQIDRQLTSLRSTEQQVRQQEITAEIIELAAGETASRRDPMSDGAG